jgi:hypothetical protein
MASHTAHIKTQEQTLTCSCPACLGLACLERPRYFAGQLLTEAELNSEQAYVLAKQRLHNRYLHGWGVVCGLEVVCHDCEGWVTIKQGYAIDPCGNDLIVSADHPFDVIKAIRECRDARRRRRRGDCDPYEPPRDSTCTDVEEHWCITLTYEEKEARPTTVLRQEPAIARCRCGSNGHQCGCGSHSSSREHATTSPTYVQASPRLQSGIGKTLPPCEPTRLLESYRLGVVEAPEDCLPDLTRDRYEGLLSWLLKIIGKDTLLAKIIDCIQTVSKVVGIQVPSKDRSILLSTAFSTSAAGTAVSYTPQNQHDAYCRLRQAVIDLYLDNPHNVRCQLLHTLDKITCPAPGQDDTVATYTPIVQPSLYHLLALLLQYLLDCICQALLPTCAPDPQDDRLILACVTIKSDTIIRICNFSCRHYAGAFPSLFYWLSLVPIAPIVAYGIQQICCSPDLVRANSPLVNDLVSLLNRLDPSGSLRQAIVAEDFALPKMYARQLAEVVSKVSFAGLTEAIRPGAVNLPTLVDKPVEEVRSTLREANIVPIERSVASTDEVSGLKNLTVSPFPAPGGKVVVYTMENRVLGFGPYDVEQQLVDKQTELDAIRKDVATLKAEVEALRGNPPR